MEDGGITVTTKFKLDKLHYFSDTAHQMVAVCVLKGDTTAERQGETQSSPGTSPSPASLKTLNIYSIKGKSLPASDMGSWLEGPGTCSVDLYCCSSATIHKLRPPRMHHRAIFVFFLYFSV